MHVSVYCTYLISPQDDETVGLLETTTMTTTNTPLFHLAIDGKSFALVMQRRQDLIDRVWWM